VPSFFITDDNYAFSGKEKEVIAMENGGNAKVNAIFEARLPQSGVQKPTNHADGPSRERFIRDKYERRKFYDPAAFVEFQQPMQWFASEQHPATAASPPVGPPSDAARLRMQERSRRVQRSPSNVSDEGNDRRERRPVSSSRKPAVAKAPVSAPPPTADLLDFLSSEPAPVTTATASNSQSFFDFNGDASISATAADKTSLMSAPAQRRMQRSRSGDGTQQPRRNKSKEDLSTLLSSSQKKTTTTTSEDILSLYRPHTNSNSGDSSAVRSDSIHSMASSSHLLSNHQPTGGYDLGSITGMMGGMSVGTNQQQSNPSSGFSSFGHPGLQQSQLGGAWSQVPASQQQQPMFTPQQMMQYQQMMMMQQQQQMMMQQQQRGMSGFSNNSSTPMAMGFGPSSSSSSPFASVPLSSGRGGPPTATGGSGSSTRRSNPNKSPEKDDPFAQFAMNAFR
jgi:hypothetical protein